MAEGSLPEAWIGEEVVLKFQDGAEQNNQRGLLEDVNDRGIVLNIRERLRFYPWGAMIHLQKRPENQAGAEAEATETV